MSGCCPEPDCRRHYPISIYRGDFDGRVFAVTRRRVVSEHEDGTATFAATERHQVTGQLREFITREREWVLSVLESDPQPDPDEREPERPVEDLGPL